MPCRLSGMSKGLAAGSRCATPPRRLRRPAAREGSGFGRGAASPAKLKTLQKGRSPRRAHEYGVGVVWEGNRGSGTSGYADYDRRFRVRVEGKADLVGTADAAFRGEPHLHNPEELLLAAVASCHMLFYLSLCARNGITVVRYSDAARGAMTVLSSGGGSFREIRLRPRVTVARGADVAAAAALHARASELCFIANSCRFPIAHEAEVEVE